MTVTREMIAAAKAKLDCGTFTDDPKIYIRVAEYAALLDLADEALRLRQQIAVLLPALERAACSSWVGSDVAADALAAYHKLEEPTP